MHVRVAYGTDQVLVDIPDGWVGNRVMRALRTEPLPEFDTALHRSLVEPIAGPPLIEILQGATSVCVAVDETGVSEPLGVVIPSLLRWLENHAGIMPDQVTLLLIEPFREWATEAGLGSLDASSLGGCRIVVHSQRDGGDSVAIHRAAPHTPLYLNRTWVEARHRILISLVEPRPLWGYSGGRAAVLPGLANPESRRTYLSNHYNLLNPNAAPGVLRNNPFHLQAVEAMQLAPPNFAIHFLATREGEVSALFCGDPIQSHLAAVNDHRKRIEPTLAEPMDIVVTGGGGHPYDCSLASVIRSMVAAASLLKPSGTLVVFAKCERGIGPKHFEQLLRRHDSPAAYFEAAARANPAHAYAWLAHPFYRVLANHEVLFYSDSIDQDSLWQLGLTPVPQPAEAINLAMETHGQDCRIAVLPDGCRAMARLSDEAVAALAAAAGPAR